MSDRPRYRGRGKRCWRTNSEALLRGRIFDDRGHRMTPSYAVKNGARYRYYVSCVLTSCIRNRNRVEASHALRQKARSATETGMAEAVKSRMSATEWTMLLVLSVLWGGSFLFVGLAVQELPPLTIVFARVALAALALQLVLKASHQTIPHERRVWKAFAGMAALNNAIPFTLIVWGQSHIASGVASILNATTPMFTVLVAHALTADECATPRKLVGVLIGFSGVAVMIGADAMRSLGMDLAGQLAILAAAISYAFAGVYGRRFKAFGVEPIAAAAGMLTASTLMLAPLMIIVDRPWALPAPSGAGVAALVGLALISTSLAYILYFRILATAGATNLLLVTFLIPVSAILLGATVLGERLEAQHFLGMAAIGTGLAAIDGRVLDPLRRTGPGLGSGRTG